MFSIEPHNDNLSTLRNKFKLPQKPATVESREEMRTQEVRTEGGKRRKLILLFRKLKIYLQFPIVM